ncbi:MAG: biotin transporter BioY [Methanosarcinales archaeon]|nr:MAG: biotin transporter BioY [Methanosarcinales archaeon]
MSSEHSGVRPMVYASMFAALTAVGALIRIPIPVSPVPLTLQVFFVLLTGLVLGSRWGATGMAVYVMLGIIGFPVFSGGSSGMGVILGPAGGYLIGFVMGAFITGLTVEKLGRSMIVMVTAMVAGLMVIYAFGVLQLFIVADLPSIWGAVVIGVVPFLIGDMIKLVAAFAVAKRIGNIIERTEV